MRHVHSLLTPENVRFELELAGIATRALSWFADVCVMAALTLCAIALAGALGLVLGQLAVAIYLLLAFAIQWGYGAICEFTFGGQTVGKRLLAIRVLSLAGTRVTLTQALLRNLLRVVDLLPGLYLVGGLCALLERDARRFGDLAAGTIVVRLRRTPRPQAILPPDERYNSFVSDPAIARACARVTAPERDLMLALALRRERLPIGVRQALFEKLAHHFESRLLLERPRFFSAERFVLNLTAVVLGAADARARGTAARPTPRN